MRRTNGTKSIDSCQSIVFQRNGPFFHLLRILFRDLHGAKSHSAYPPGTILFHEKQKPSGIFMLCSGEVKLSVSSSRGRLLILKIARPGDVLGLAATLTGNPFEATATAVHSCKVIFVCKDKFLSFIAEHSEANAEVLRQLCVSYIGACDLVRTFGLSASVPERLAKLLLELSAEGRTAQEWTRSKSTLTHEEIAEFIGSARETVTRTLSKFKHQRLVVTHGSTLSVPNRAILKSMIES
jgi:CRP/FNR family transcriptional regulator, cyclic AMP receptor protein